MAKSVASRILISLSIAASATSACASQAPERQAVSKPSSTAYAVTFDAAALDRLKQAIAKGEYGNTHSVLFYHDGNLLFEAYFRGRDHEWGRDLGVVGFGPETPHDVRSVTKTVVSTLVGIAIAQGKIPSIDTTVYDLLPRYRHLLSGDKRKLTVRDLLTMSAGLDWDEFDIPYSDPRNGETEMDRSDDPVGFVLSRPIVKPPGAVWNYNGGLTQTLAAILENATGMPLEDYAQQVLFGPLGIGKPTWVRIHGMASAAAGLRLTPRQMGRLGVMFAAGGRWTGRQIVSRSWLADAMRYHIAVPADPKAPDPAWDVRDGYGYQWWYNDIQTAVGPASLSCALGNGGQRICIVPQLRLVMVVTSGDYDDRSAGWNPENILIRVIGAGGAISRAGATVH